MISRARAGRLREALEPLVESFGGTERVAFDPIEAPRRYAAPEDQEVAGLLAAGLAYGRVELFRPKLFALLDEMGPSPAAFVRGFVPERDGLRFASFVYRFNLPGDIGALFAGMGQALHTHGSLGRLLAASLEQEGDLRQALSRFSRSIREAGAVRVGDSMGPIRALDHLLADPMKGGACKRLLLYLRWMVRKDLVDLGTWEGLIPRSALVIPVDTHIMRISKLLGLTRRNDPSWRTAEEITASLRLIDPDDPVRYDFALCHLGMSGACPAKRDRERCRVCPLSGECPTGRRLLARAS